MYRTLDTYAIKLSRPLHWQMVERFNSLLEKHNLMADFRQCFDSLTDGKFEFSTSCSYKSYKTFFFVFYQVFGPFTAEVSFDEDYPPEGCGYNTTVNFEVDEAGNYVFALLNVLSASENAESSEEFKRRRSGAYPPFEANCKKEGNICDWNNEQRSGGHL